VSLLSGTAEPSRAGSKPAIPIFGNLNRYKSDPAKGKALLADAGYTRKTAVVQRTRYRFGAKCCSANNDIFLQQNLKEACGVTVEFNVVECRCF